MDASFIESRRMFLELFLQKICNTDAFQCAEVYRFLELDNPGRNISYHQDSNQQQQEEEEEKV
jgi:hypothetical protein